MYSHSYRHRVRYRECDPMGVVYHAHYIDYFEAARTEALREMGIAYKTLEDSGIIMPVVDLAVQYKRPAHYDDVVVVTSQFADIPRVRVKILYDVHREADATLLATGHVTLCFVDRARNRPVPAPAHVQALFDDALSSSQTA